MKNPNAAAAAVSIAPAAGIAEGILWAADRFFDLEPPRAVGYVIAGGVISLSLFVGRNGLKGLARMLWRGSGG